MKVHGDDMVAAGCLEHVGHQFGRDGGAGFVFFVLACVGEVGKDGGNASGGGCFTGVDHDQKLHQAIVDVVGSRRLEDEY